MNEKLKNNIKLFLINRLKFKNQNASKIVIFSNPRSGSTWLMELLNKHIENSTTIWEPLHQTKGILRHSLNNNQMFSFLENKIITESYINDIDNILKQPFNHWTISNSTFKSYFNPDYYIIKFVRAKSYALEYVNNCLNPCKPIYLLRHPIALAVSFAEMFDKSFSFKFYTPMVYNKLFDKFPVLKSLNPGIESIVGYWCLQNYSFYKGELNDKVIPVYYEELFLHPKVAFSEILDELNIKNVKNMNFSDIEKPSRTSKDLLKKKYQLSKWEKHIVNLDLWKIQELLRFFDVTDYDVNSDLPKKIR